MGVRRVMYWRQPAEARTMQNYLALAARVQACLNTADALPERWSAEVTTRRRAEEPDAPGMFLGLDANKDVAREVVACALDPRSFPGAAEEDGERGGGGDLPGSGGPVVLVLRDEARCVRGEVPVKEYLARCRAHKQTRKSTLDGAQFRCGDFSCRVGRVETMQGTYAGALVEVEYHPSSDAAAAEAALRDYADALARVASEVPGAAGELAPAATLELMAKYGLEVEAFGEEHLAVLYVDALSKMQT